MMQFRSVKGNIVYITFLIIIIYSFLYIDLQVQKQASMDFTMMPMLISTSIGYPMIGAMIGLPSIWKQRKAKGSYTLNVPRLFLLVVPAFIIANFHFILIIFPSLAEPLITKYTSILVLSGSASKIFNLIFGYALITSFYKESDSKQSTSLVE